MANDELKQTTAGSNLMLYPLPDKRPVSAKPASFLNQMDALLSKYWAQIKKLLDAVTNASSVNGKVEIDRAFAAKILKDKAADDGMADVAGAKVTRIMRAIDTLLRREKLGTKQRRLAMNAAVNPAE
jgi:hypothetical protein